MGRLISADAFPLVPRAQAGRRIDVVRVSRTFGSIRAVEDVSFTIVPGTVHALIGENGAGKSTVAKMIAGVIGPDAGHVAVDGQPVAMRTPRDALELGIATIDQEVSLVPRLDVMGNVYLGAEPRRAGVIRRGGLRQRWAAILEDTGFTLPGTSRAGSLRLAILGR